MERAGKTQYSLGMNTAALSISGKTLWPITTKYKPYTDLTQDAAKGPYVSFRCAPSVVVTVKTFRRACKTISLGQSLIRVELTVCFQVAGFDARYMA